MAMLVSVLMPAWNSERWIEAAMTSVLTQTHRELELVVVDDASTDRTPDLIASFRDSRVRHVRLERRQGGVGFVLNRGLPHCQGELVARLDADDVALSHRLALQVAWLRDHPEVALVGGNMHILDDRGRTLGRAVMWHGRSLHYALHLANVLFHPAVTMRRAAIPATGYPAPRSRSEDWMLYLAMMRAGHRIEALDAHVGIYRRHPAAVTHGPPRVTIAAEMGDHVAASLGHRHDTSTVAAWVGPFTVGDAADPEDLADLARRMSPDAMPARALGGAPAWTPAGLRRARRVYVRRLAALVSAAARARRLDVVARLAPLVPRATLAALRLPRRIANRPPP
ncbi:MAG: glycosyltransferase [Deltaproteobacteria bacterium]|nr:glycosyltransferase [Deltaproteobacteria bacterium]